MSFLQFIHFFNNIVGGDVDIFNQKLQEFTKQIEKLKLLKSKFEQADQSVALNLITIDCHEMNTTIIEKIDFFIFKIVDFFMQENRKHNKKLVDM